jgi:hypothetical protein
VPTEERHGALRGAVSASQGEASGETDPAALPSQTSES